MIKILEKILKKVYKNTILGFYYIALVFSNGFFFYFYFIFSLLEKIIPLKSVQSCKRFFQRRQNDPVAFLILVFIFMLFSFSYTFFYVDKDDVVYVNDVIINTTDDINKTVSDESVISIEKKEINLFRKYSSIGINKFNIYDLKNTNLNTIGWIMVDNTNINYPVVQTVDNEYYLNHNFNNNISSDGWIFMDYRNSTNMNDKNTIIYGHNLLNKTAFGSIVDIFSDEWFNKSNHYIIISNGERKFVYEIFSYYIINPETYYLNIDDISIETLKNRSARDFDVSVSENDKIITLSTCTDDNKSRRVVHAKLINE